MTKSKNFLKVFLLITFLLTGTSFINAQSLNLFSVSDLRQVFEDGYGIPASGDTIKAFGIGGEIISAQCVFSSKTDLTGVTVEISPLKSLAGDIFQANNIGWNFVGSIPLSKNAPNQPLKSVVRTAPARFPDYLMAERQLNVKQGIYQAVWLTISIPGNKAGIFSGKLTVRSNQGDQSLPLSLTIYPLNLPAERHLKVTIWDNRSKFGEYHGIKEKYSDAWFAMLGKYAANMGSHRQNIFQVPLNSIGVRKNPDGRYDFDFALFDRTADIFWNTGKFDMLELGLSDNKGELTNRGEKRWASTEIFISDIELRDPGTGKAVTVPGREMIPQLLPALEDHLRSKGWLHKSVIHICDEPAMHNVLSWTAVSRWIHQYAPDLRRMDAIETSYLTDLGEIEVAVPKIDILASWYDSFKKAPGKGIGLWFYTVGIFQASLLPNKTIDMPVIESRVLHWLNYKYDAPGYLHWGWNQWTGDVYKETGQHLGDGWHVYPSRDGVLNSIRWEQLRNGVQDYELFKMLEDKVKRLKDSLGFNFNWIDPASRGKEIASRVVKSFTEHSGDAEVLYSARKMAITEILDFNRSPRIYVQTDPIETSEMTDQLSVAVYGWAEPPSKVTVNGQELPVSKQGLFLSQTKLTTKNNTIRVVAINGKGTKEVTRVYFVRE